MDLIDIVTQYGLDTVIIAIVTVMLTGLIKQPVKILAEKFENSKKITKFITFLPVFIGFGLTVLSSFILVKQISFTKEFFIQWLSAVSLSLAIYAFWEKFVPSEKKILSENEIQANKEIIEDIKNVLNISELAGSVSDFSETDNSESNKITDGQPSDNKKIILSNKK